MPSRAAIYVRISHDKTGAGLGVARQEQDCRALAERQGYQVVQVLSDNDVSASRGRIRAGYQLLLDVVDQGQVDVVLAWHTDRLHRSPRELENYIELCERKSCPTETVTAGAIDLATPAGRFAARIHGSVAKYEVEQKSVRQKRKHLELAQAGKPTGGLRAYGYADDRVTVVQHEADVIVEAAGRVLAGESLRAVTADLTDRAIPTVTGKAWSAVTLREMLCRGRLAGIREHTVDGVTASYPASWPAILPLDTHLALRALLRDPGRSCGPRTTGRVMLLSGIVRCGDCGRPMSSSYGGKHRPVTSQKSYACTVCKMYAAAPAVDEHVVAAVLERLADERLHEQLGRSAVQPLAGDEHTVLMAERRLDEIGREFAADPAMPAAVVRSMVQAVHAQAESARDRLAVAAAARSRPAVTVLDRAGWDVLPLGARRALISTVLPDLTVARPTRVRRSFDPERVLLDGRRS